MMILMSTGEGESLTPCRNIIPMQHSQIEMVSDSMDFVVGDIVNNIAEAQINLCCFYKLTNSAHFTSVKITYDTPGNERIFVDGNV